MLQFLRRINRRDGHLHALEDLFFFQLSGVIPP